MKSINFIIREIEQADLEKGFFQTLSNLTILGRIRDNLEQAKKILQEIKSYPLYKIFVAVKNDNTEIIGSITLLIEQKFIHDGGKAGHIEDVVTRREYEGIGIGSALVSAALAFAREKNCYKVILNCSEKNVPFYEKIGFRRNEISMRYDVMP
ncbi:MAG: GNAT family N-acetyltransferase [Thermoproteota archaeon]|nr:GNAT family N-acetyltransferase [Thermoproteota archaeon]